ncbi:V-type ATP synthase subunit C [bioreactor metagenome]|uniref:V-type ATP synthase subunit C n=1 Tax=bioreactor metagenome TaxID=1076179 RepID=A0A645A1A7_9ZZZZ
MCAASGEAVESLAKTGDPQNVDILIDKACFDDMLSGAESFGSKFMIDYVKTKIDVYNITSFIRCSKMNKSFIFLDLILSDKGYIEKCVFNDRYSKKGENEDGNTSASKLFELLSMTQYSSLFSKYNAESFSSLSFAEVERIFDFFFAGKINSLKYIPFGPEVIKEYILNREREIKNMRLVFAGKRVSLSNDEIRLNLR